MALIQGLHVLHRLNKGNVKNLQVRDSGPLWPSCSQKSLCCLQLVDNSLDCLGGLVKMTTTPIYGQTKCVSL